MPPPVRDDRTSGEPGVTPGYGGQADQNAGPAGSSTVIMMLLCAPAAVQPVTRPEFGSTLARAPGGDEAAFARIFRDVQPALLRYLWVIAAESADDVAADTWPQVVAGPDASSGEMPGFSFRAGSAASMTSRRWT